MENSVEVLCGSFLLFYLSRLFSLWINYKVYIICRKPAVNEEKVWKSKGAKKMFFLAYILSRISDMHQKMLKKRPSYLKVHDLLSACIDEGEEKEGKKNPIFSPKGIYY